MHVSTITPISCRIRNICNAAKSEPLVTSGTVLTVSALAAGTLSTVTRTSMLFVPICGVPAILLFGYKIFFNTDGMAENNGSP